MFAPMCQGKGNCNALQQGSTHLSPCPNHIPIPSGDNDKLAVGVESVTFNNTFNTWDDNSGTPHMVFIYEVLTHSEPVLCGHSKDE